MPPLLLAIAFLVAVQWSLSHLPVNADAGRVLSIFISGVVLLLALAGLVGMVLGS